MRMAIMQFQLDIGCSGKNTSETLRGFSRPNKPLGLGKARLDWHQAELASETRSHVDAYLTLGSNVIADVSRQ